MTEALKTELQTYRDAANWFLNMPPQPFGKTEDALFETWSDGIAEALDCASDAIKTAAIEEEAVQEAALDANEAHDWLDYTRAEFWDAVAKRIGIQLDA